MGGTLTSGGPLTSNLEAAKAGNLITSDLGRGSTESGPTSTFDLIFKSDTLPVSDPPYKDAVTAGLAPIQAELPIGHPYTAYNVPNPAEVQSLTPKSSPK